VLPLAAAGALAAGVGRTLLALGARAAGPRVLPARWRDNIAALSRELQERPTLGAGALALFALGPVPSNQLFLAAGIARTPLPPLLAVFVAARFVSYVIWISAAEKVASRLEDTLSPRVGDSAAVAAQLLGLALLIGIMQVDWAALFRRLAPR